MTEVGWRVPLAFVAAFVHVSCSSLSCTVVGCGSGVSIDLRALPLLLGALSELTVCVDKQCHTTRPDAEPLQEVRATNFAKGKSVVSVTMKGPKGATLVSGSVATEFVKDEPNGHECGPTCYSALLHVTAEGKLVAA